MQGAQVWFLVKGTRLHMLQLRAHKLQLKILDVAVKTLQAATKIGNSQTEKKKKRLKRRENFQTSLMRPALPMPKPDKNTIHTHKFTGQYPWWIQMHKSFTKY